MNNNFDLEKYVSVDQARIKKEDSNIKTFFPSKGVTDQDKAKFCLELSVMLQARVSLNKALQILADQNKKEKVKTILQGVLKEVQKGSSFSAALGKYPEVFDNLFVVSAEVGQESGKLSMVMMNLASYLEKISMLKRKLKQALAYPALVLSVAVITVLFLLLFIVPTFAEMFKSLQVELPLSTQIILGLSDWILAYGYWIGIILVTVIFISKSVSLPPGAREWLDNAVFRIPVIGDIVLKNLVARFCRTLGTLLQAQVSLVNALEITKRIFTAKNIEEEISGIIYHVRQGKTVAEPLVESRIFPPMVSQMIAVGEETSELDTMLMKVAEYYEKEIDSAVETLSNVIEPVLILFLGIVVAAVLISMYMPMFELMNVIS